MATFVQDGYAEDSSGTPVASLGVTLTGVAAGNLVAVWGKHEGATASISVSDATSTLQAGTYQANPPADSFGQWNYILSANSGNRTYTESFGGASRAFPSIIAFEYSAAGKVWSFLGQSAANGTSTAPNSGNFTTSGDDGVAFGGYAEDSTNFTSSEQINSVAADGRKQTPAGADPRNYTVAWRKAFTAGYTGAASGTLGSSVAWACAGIAFSAAPAPATIPLLGQAIL
jgi:hypothetical protein